MALLFPPDRADLIRSGRREGIRFVLDGPAWANLASDASTRAELTPFLGLWGDASGHVHALFHDGRTRPLTASVAVEAGRYHALSARVPAAAPFERIVRDLFGFEAMHARDLRPLLDHGAWSATAPLAARPGPPPRAAEMPEWREPPDEGSMLVERGPVGLPEMSGSRLRAALSGTSIGTAELGVGWGHRGISQQMLGLTPEAASGLAARLAPNAAVAHALAFARAVEAASATVVPVRASVLREALGEAERVAAFLTTLWVAARAGNARRFGFETALLLERVRRSMAAALGHRFGAGLVAPGGLARDLDAAAVQNLLAMAALVSSVMRRLARFYEAGDGLASRASGIGRIAPSLAASRTACGIVGRASGQGFDARRSDAVVPVDAPSSEAGDADARLRLRLAGVGQAGSRLSRLLEILTPGPVRVPLGPVTGEGLGTAEAPEGDVWHVVRLDEEGRLTGFFARDPALVHLGLFEAACAGVEWEDAGIVQASFGLSAEAIDG